MTDNRPTLLYISPVLPLPAGNGLAMRAYNVLKALAEKYRVRLIAGSRYFRYPPEDVSGELDRLCESITCITFQITRDPGLLFRSLSHRLVQSLYYRVFHDPWDYFPLTGRIRKTLNGIDLLGQIDVIHVFRLYMFPLGRFYLQRNPSAFLQLDLDDLESDTRRRIGELFRLCGNAKTADRTLREAARFESIERAVLPECRRIFVCSEADREKLCTKYDLARVTVVPNTVQLQACALPRYASTKCFTFLFVGSMAYYPNRDAVLFFCRQVWPLLRRLTTKTISLVLVGGGADREMARAAAQAVGVELAGHVADVEPFYDRADAVVVPIRAGGGTRIKILEAFAHLRPVVSTHIGMEGIDAHNGVHALLADGEQSFAVQCARLVEDFVLGRSLAENALDLLRTRYRPDLIKERLLDG